MNETPAAAQIAATTTTPQWLRIWRPVAAVLFAGAAIYAATQARGDTVILVFAVMFASWSLQNFVEWLLPDANHLPLSQWSITVLVAAFAYGYAKTGESWLGILAAALLAFEFATAVVAVWTGKGRQAKP